MISEFIFFSSIILCIALGSQYKKIEDKELKRNYGTGLGILLTFLICGYQIYHSLFITWGNIIIIKCCEKKYGYLHVISLIYTLMYLTYMSCYIENANYMLWLNQTIALRLVGLAFEINAAYKLKFESNKLIKIPAQLKSNLVYDNYIPEDAKAVDIIAYTYYFIGLHKGPYYRWKVFNEHFDMPFGNMGDCRKITEQKLRKAVIYGIIYLFIRANFPIELYYEKEFYEQYGADMRYLYNVPQLVMYVLQYELVSMLCTAVCTESGFGVYPVQCQAIPGHGPTANFSLLNMAATKPSVALEQEYNFEMLNSFDNEQLLMGPRMKDTLRGWDMSTQYWFWAYIYKSCVNKVSPEIRSALSFTAWSLWRGVSIQQIFILSTLWVHVHLEKEYSELFITSKSMKMPWDIGFTIMRAFCLIYLTPCLVLHDLRALLVYYNSLFWIFHIVLLITTLCLLCAHKFSYSPISARRVREDSSEIPHHKQSLNATTIPKLPTTFPNKTQNLSTMNPSKSTSRNSPQATPDRPNLYSPSNAIPEIPSNTQENLKTSSNTLPPPPNAPASSANAPSD